MSNTQPRRAWARRLAVLVSAALLVPLTACGGGSAASSGDGERVTLKLADPGNNGLLAYAKKTGVLEEELDEVGADVEWGGSFASFTATIDALRSGDVNVLEGAISPAIGYLAENDDLKIFSVADRTTDPQAPIGDGLVVPGDSDIYLIYEVRGCTFAVNRGGRGEYLLLKALDQAGIDHDEVERVYLNPQDAAGALASGSVDAWWAIVRGYPAAVANGARTIVTNTDVDDDDLNMFAAREEIVEANPEALRTFQRVLAELAEEAREEPEKFQNVFQDSGPAAVEGEALKRDIEVQRYTQPQRLVTDDDLATVQAVADYFADNGLVSSRIDAATAVTHLGADE